MDILNLALVAEWNFDGLSAVLGGVFTYVTFLFFLLFLYACKKWLFKKSIEEL